MAKIFIVGGGVTGLAVANSIEGESVTLVEATKNLGGVLRDLCVEEEFFYSSCQYFNGGTKWSESLGLASLFYQFDHRYASYTDIFETPTVSVEFAGPVYDGQVVELDYTRRVYESNLAERLALYPTILSRGLKRWFEYIGVDIQTTHYSTAKNFQADRVYLKSQRESVEAQKKNSQLIDEMYGIPKCHVGRELLKAYLPRLGFNYVFDCHYKKSAPNINIKTSTTVNCELKNNVLALKSKAESFNPDLIIWTANPTKLLAQVFNSRLDSQRVPVEVMCGYLDRAVDAPLYIQVFSTQSRVLRIYVYNLRGRGCFTIEKAKDNQTEDDVLNFCQMVTDNLLTQKFTAASTRHLNFRYDCYTVNDYNLLSTLNSQETVKNLIVADYLVNGRDQRINSIMRRFGP